MSGESVAGYRARLVSRLQHHSSVWKNSDLRHLSALSPSAVANAEAQIYADAARIGNDKTRGNADGSLRERKVTDEAGRSWTEYAGSTPLPWMGGFMGAKRRLVGAVDSTGRRVFPTQPVTWRS
jgi:hypothetical protein